MFTIRFISRYYIILLIILISNLQTNAQLCNGSLGDPVVNINFGSGSVGQSNLTGVGNGYIYLTTNCPNDGQYTIASQSPACFNGDWWPLTKDHTPNSVNGNMMIVNATYAPGDFFVDTVDGLCNGTTYEFAAWILNLSIPSSCSGSPILPNVTFSIETTAGVVIQQYQTGDIPTANAAVWNQYGFFFSAPTNSGSIVIRMRNNAPGGCGNDLVIDDITFRPCGPKVVLNSSTGSNNINSCVTDAMHYTFTGNASAGFNNINYQWQVSSDTGKTWNDIVGATSSSYYLAVNPVGYYLYRLSIAEGTAININACRIVSDTIIYNRAPLPQMDVAKDLYCCTGDTIVVNANPSNTYTWSGPAFLGSSSASLNFNNLALTDSGKYIASMVSSYGCINTDSFYLNIKQRPVAKAVSAPGICSGDTVLLIGSGGKTYTWEPATDVLNPNDSVTLAYPKDTITYTLYATAGICTDSQSIRIVVWTKPTANIAPVAPMYEGHPTMLYATVTGSDISYFWNPRQYIENEHSLTPTIYPSVNTTYYITAMSDHDCGTATDSVFVRVYSNLHIPNAFSPNGDGYNDYWMIGNLFTYPDAEVRVFDRGGNMVLNVPKNFTKWDGNVNGNPVPNGTYYYLINLHENQPVISGWLQVIR